MQQAKSSLSHRSADDLKCFHHFYNDFLSSAESRKYNEMGLTLSILLYIYGLSIVCGKQVVNSTKGSGSLSNSCSFNAKDALGSEKTQGSITRRIQRKHIRFMKTHFASWSMGGMFVHVYMQNISAQAKQIEFKWTIVVQSQ